MIWIDSISENLIEPIVVRRTRPVLCLSLVIATAFLLAAAWIYQITRLHFTDGVVTFGGQTARVASFPFNMRKVPSGKFTVKANVNLANLYPTILAFYPHDVLWGIIVNGHRVENAGLPLSASHHEGRSINLAPFLHSGSNEVDLDMEVSSEEASLSICPSLWDKYSLILSVLILGAALSTGAFFYCFFNLRITGAEIIVLLGSFLLRLLYLLGTPYFVRSYDWWGHVDYLDFVSQHLALPEPHSNWEAYQPPLYYCVVGGITKVLFFLGMPEEQRYFLWQALSLALSLAVLFVVVWLGRLLYSKEVTSRLYLLAVLGVTPALVFNASRVSNDVLVNLLDFLWLGSLLAFWQYPKKSTWLALSLIIGLAVLTKASAFALIPISIVCVTLCDSLDRKWKIYAGLALAGTIVLIDGWFYLPRAFHEDQVDTFVVGNIHTLNPDSHIRGVFFKSIVFNPLKVLRYPFVQPWAPRDDYFLEFFFKSIFVGEWYLGSPYRWVARTFILGALLLIPVFVRGVWCSLRRKKKSDLPLLVCLIVIFGTQWIFVQIAPYLPSQDFRYSVILLVPIVYFLKAGVSSLNAQWGKNWLFLLQLQMLFCGIYLVEIAFQG